MSGHISSSHIFVQFLLRILRTYRRSFTATLMMFGFPVAFFAVFLILAMQSAGGGAVTKIAVMDMGVEDPLVRRLRELPTVEVTIVKQTSAEKLVSDQGYVAVVGLANAEGRRPLTMAQQHEADVWLILRAASSTATGKPEIAGVKLDPTELAPPPNEWLSYVLPGLLAMAALQLGIYGTAAGILDERSRRTLRLFSLLPIPSWLPFSAEVSARLMIGCLQLLVMVLLIVFVAGFHPTASWVPIIATYLLGMAMMVSIGVAIGGILPDQKIGTNILTFTSLLMLFFGDLFGPMSESPLVRPLVMINPITYMADALRQQMITRPPLLSLHANLALMTVWLCISAGIAYRYFKYETRT